MFEEVKDLQQCQLEILKEIDRVCKEEGLEYCLAYGSCLGAVRHKGFIPWDDDIDLYMPIDDYLKFNKLQSSFKSGYFIQNADTDKEYGLMITRIRNSNTTLIENEECKRDINHGVFVDVYPLLNVPEKRFPRKRAQINSMLYRLLQYNATPKNRGKLMKIGSFVILKLTPGFLKKIIKRRALKYLYSIKATEMISTYYGDESHISYPKQWIFPAQNAPFEDMMVPIPGDFDSYLKFTYGDYMKLPPEEKRAVHHNYKVLDVKKSYLEYKGIGYYAKQK